VYFLALAAVAAAAAIPAMNMALAQPPARIIWILCCQLSERGIGRFQPVDLRIRQFERTFSGADRQMRVWRKCHRGFSATPGGAQSVGLSDRCCVNAGKDRAEDPAMAMADVPKSFSKLRRCMDPKNGLQVSSLLLMLFSLNALF